MDVLKEYQERITTGIQKLDLKLLHIGRRVANLLSEYRFLIAVMLIGFVVWSVVFNIALTDYLNTNRWNSRGVWLGSFPTPAEFDLFGYTIYYQFEGYTDYSFYYVHWGHNILNGVMPYSPNFGYLEMDGIINENGAFMFPPFTAYLYGAGIWLENIIGPGNWGIGLLLASFGYLTALPVYGIAKEVSKNSRVGEVAALTYLLNPLVMYHINYLWLNPSAFYFFFFAGFYALVKERRHVGTILIVSAALFKQTAWFLGIPLVVFLLLRKRRYPDEESDLEETQDEPEKESKFAFLTNYFDFREFFVSVVVAVSFAGAVMLPTLIAQSHFWNYWKLALGHFSFEGNYNDVPAYGVPQTLPVLPIVAGMPDVAEFLDTVFLSGGPLVFGVVVAFGVMMLLDKMEGEENIFMRRLLFVTMLLMLWVSLTGMRGVFKYYFAMFGPFFSIFASARMIRGGGGKDSENEAVPVSLSMFILPFVFTLLILIPDRNIYLLFVTFIFISYLLAPLFDRLYDIVKRPFRYLKQRISSRIQIEQDTITIPEELSASRKSRFVKLIIILYSIAAGVSSLLYGVYICFPRIATAIPVILQYFVVAGTLILVGTQLIAVSATGFSKDESSPDSSYLLKMLFTTTTGIIILFGIFSYLLSWDIELFVERQMLVISSTLMIIWVVSLVVKMKKHLNTLASVFVTIGASLATWTWFSLGNTIMYSIGFACVAGLILHILLILLDYLESATIMNTPHISEPVEVGVLSS